ncbi:MAG: serine dehydratase subunit alpha family protein [Oscillospiraceae bacterium]|nr:serine dehydratase subunit alpha family protein [Oscillospiraceae bacterium]
MSLPEHVYNAYHAILKEELLVAMGCTEPIAIAYGAAILRKTLGREPACIRSELSGNIIKNVKSVIVPATGGLHGIEAAISAGIIAGRPEKKLEVLTAITAQTQPQIAAFRDRCVFTLEEMNSDYPFDLRLTGTEGEDTAVVRISKNHTNVTCVALNGVDLTQQYLQELEEETCPTDRSLLNVCDIVTFADETPLDALRPLLQRQIEMNMAIAEEGIRNNWGACIGKVLYRGGDASLRDRARAYAAAGSDARMSGCEMPVSIISGSGNQGMTASIPVVIYARAMGASEETMLRALIVSDLITIHQKTGIGCLSAYCGAISAGCGCGCGISYLYGGRYYEIAHTLVNAVAILSGTICDGAKPSCAAKIAMAVEAGIMGYEMMRSGKQFYGGDGIVTKGVENTIRNVGRLARDGMSETDRQIIRIMLDPSC